ncbi:Fc.00g098170.m01.CDS01 [Cosmosporella sp. VM-42]
MASSPTSTKLRREPRDTGFPEPFNGDRNTTLPHPDADLSPNACICQEDIDPDRALRRHRRSFLRKNNKHTLQHGKITPQSEALYSVLSLVSTDHESETPKARSPSLSSVRLSKDGTDSIVSRRDDETPPTSPDVPSHRSKKGFLKKWRKD